MVYADSLTAISLGDYRYLGGKGAPDVSKRFQTSIDKIGALKCGVLLTTHPGASGMMEKLAARMPAHNPFADSAACRVLAEGAQSKLAARLASERGVTAAWAPPLR